MHYIQYIQKHHKSNHTFKCSYKLLYSCRSENVFSVYFFQDFCHGQVMWPPLSTLQVRLAEPGRSCKQICQEEQLICEPSFFQHLNKDKDLARWSTHWKTTVFTFILTISELSCVWCPLVGSTTKVGVHLIGQIANCNFLHSHPSVKYQADRSSSVCYFHLFGRSGVGGQPPLPP